MTGILCCNRLNKSQFEEKPLLYHGSNTGNIKVLKPICNCSYIKILGRLNTMVNVVGCIRVSTVNQVKEGYSLGE